MSARATSNQRTTAVTAAGLVFAGGAALILGWLSTEVFDNDTAHFDEYVRATIHAGASPPLTAVMKFFTNLGSGASLIALLLAAMIALWTLRMPRAMVKLAVTMAGATVLVEALKVGFHRPRPTPFFDLTAPHSFSYPSGHALYSLAFFATLAALSADRLAAKWARIAVWAAAAVAIAMIGISRIYLGVHYPTDVIAGYLTALIWVLAVSFGDRFYARGK